MAAETFLPAVNGLSRSVVEVASRLAGRGHDLLVVAPGRPARVEAVDLGPDVVVERVPSLPLPGYPTLDLGLPTRRVERLLARFRADVVYLAGPVVLGAAALGAARRLGVPTLAVHQTDLAGFAAAYELRLAGPLSWWWLRRVYERADRTLAPSRASVRALRRHGVAGVHLWPRGVDLDRFSPAHRSPSLRLAWGAGADGVVVGYVGRLAREKRLHLLARTAALPGCRMVLIGDGPARRELEARLPRATFLGQLDGLDLSRAVASLDVFVHTGPAETFGQALQEALAAGVPVVAPAAGGPLDLVEHDGNGLLFPAGDEVALAASVARLVADAATRRRLGQAARPSVAARSWDAVVDRLEGHLNDVVSPGRRARVA